MSVRILVIDSEPENQQLRQLQEKLWRDIHWTLARTREEAYTALFGRSSGDRPFERLLINWASHLGDTAQNSDHFVRWLASGAKDVQNVPVFPYTRSKKFAEYLQQLPAEFCTAVIDPFDIPDLCRKLGLMIPPKQLPPFEHAPIISGLPEEDAQTLIEKNMHPDIREQFERSFTQREALRSYSQRF